MKLRKIAFADGSRLKKVSRYAFSETKLAPETASFPNCAKMSAKAFQHIEEDDDAVKIARLMN